MRSFRMMSKIWSLHVFLIMLAFTSCNESVKKPGASIERKVDQRDTSACISLQGLGGCGWVKVCPSDTLMYKAVRLMTYVDSNLAEAEDTALRPMCGSAVAVLADSDSIEAYAFTYGSGASFQDVAIYIKREDEKFVEVKDFNEKHEARKIQPLDKFTNGLRHFLVEKVYVWDKLELSFNGKGFDTIYYLNILYREYKKSGLRGYGADTLMQIHGATFKFVANHEVSDLNGCLKLKGFIKDISGDYQFAGFFPGLPDPEFYEIRNDWMVLKVSGSIDCGIPETRLHYWDGERYVGKLIPEYLRQVDEIEAGRIAMHPDYHIEYFTEIR